MGQNNSSGSGNVNRSGRNDANFPGTGDDKGLIYQPWKPGDPNNPTNVQGNPNDSGSAATLPGNSTGPGVPNRSQVPYNQADPTYRDSAGRALDGGYIPPQMKEFIRSYFNELDN